MQNQHIKVDVERLFDDLGADDDFLMKSAPLANRLNEPGFLFNPVGCDKGKVPGTAFSAESLGTKSGKRLRALHRIDDDADDAAPAQRIRHKREDVLIFVANDLNRLVLNRRKACTCWIALPSE